MSASHPVPQPPILAAEQRAWNYWFLDGWTNLVVGVGVLLMAYCTLNPPRWPPRPLPVALWLVSLVLYMAAILKNREIVEWLKTRTTYPRTGYVRPPFPDDPAEAANLTTFSLRDGGTPQEVQLLRMQRRITWMIVVALVAVACFGFVIIQDRWIWSACGALFSAAMIIGRRVYRWTWILPVGFPIVGLIITTFAPPHRGPAYFITGLGILFVLDGATTLIRYLLQNPKPKAPAE